MQHNSPMVEVTVHLQHTGRDDRGDKRVDYNAKMKKLVATVIYRQIEKDSTATDETSFLVWRKWGR